MKVLLLIAALAITGSSALPHCSPPVEGKIDLLPNPADCNTFYQCVGGVPILMKCSPGLQWADALKRCDWPNVAQCHETETTDAPPSTTPSDHSTAAPAPRPDHCPQVDTDKDVLLPNPKDCGSFYKCMKGVPYLIECPAGEEWADALQRCDWPEVANCHVAPQLLVLVADDEECPAVDQEGHEIFFPNPKNCSTYYMCEHGSKTLLPCPEGLKWHQAVHHCDWPDHTDCQESK